MDLTAAVFNYLYGLLPFLIELFICEALFVFRQPKRSFFVARVVAGIPVAAALTFLIACLFVKLPNNPLFGSAIYLAAFALSAGLLCFCFKLPFRIIMLYGVAAYALQNCVYRIKLLLEITGVVWRLSLAVGSSVAAQYIITIIMLTAACVATYFLCVKRIESKGPENIYSRSVLLISAFTLVVTLLLCSYANAYWWESLHLSVVNYCFTVLCNVFILVIISGMFQNVELKNEIAFVKKQLWLRDKRQYELAKEDIELINIRCHDLKHKVHAMRTGALCDDAELAEIEGAVAIYDSVVHTGCDPIDVVLTEKCLVCAQNHIKLSCMADGSGLKFMQDSELYSLFGNMLTNAVDAACSVECEDKRVISLTVSTNAGLVMINCVNYFDGTIAMDGDLPKTRNADKTEHGFGMKSMRMLVKKYGGEMYFTADNGVFDLKIVIPERTEKSQTQKVDAA